MDLLPPLIGFLLFSVQLHPPEIVASTSSALPSAVFASASIPEALKARMRAVSWHAGCPAPLDDLQALTLTYWDFNGVSRQGMLLVNRAVAPDVLSAFSKLYAHGFLIERMQPVEDFDGSDDRSMQANNTSAFNCRDVTGKPGRFSNHSWGRAIDINPLTNPMLLHGKYLPPEGARYADRTKAVPGAILGNSFIVDTFRSIGWTWGGDWKDPDYQHFEKPDPHRP